MEKYLCHACATFAEPRRIRVDSTGLYAICGQCGAEIKIDQADDPRDPVTNTRDPVTGEELVGVREHMPRGAAD
jgi:hypothetical protein